jgi:hypothetical protein
MSTAVDVSTDVASGAIKAGGEIAGAAADMVRGATETLVNVATGAARELSPDKGHKRSKDD